MQRAAADSSQLWTSFRHQVRFYLRTNRFIGLLIVTVLLSAIGFAFQLYSGAANVRASQPDSASFLSSSLSSIGFEVALVGAFFGGDAIARDFGTGTGYFTLVLPIRRNVLLLGRFIAASVASIVVILPYYALSAANALYFYGTLPAAFAASIGLGAIFTLATVALAFFFSSLLKNPAVSMIVTVLILWLALPSVTSAVGSFGGIEPWASLSYASNVVSLIFVGTYEHASTLTAGGFTIHVFRPYIWEGVAIMVAYLVVFLGISIFLYERKELRG